MAKPQVVFVLGGPGAGKGTQCENIMKEFGFKHIPTGQMLRDAMTDGSPDGLAIAEFMNKGEMVPVKYTIKLLQDAMAASSENKFLLDGFPRNEDNLNGWEEQMADKADVKFVLFFKCRKEICQERVIERGQSSGRTDDNIKSFVKRFQQHLNESMPAVDRLEQQNLVRVVSSEPPADQVFEEVKKLFKDL